MKDIQILEVSTEAITFVPNQFGDWSLVILDLPSGGPKALWFRGSELERVDDVPAETFPEAIKITRESFSSANIERVLKNLITGSMPLEDE